MSATFDDSKRQTIPRFLDYSTASALGLLRTIRKQEEAEPKPRETNVRRDWQSKPSLYSAVDLVAESLITKEFESSDAIKAARYILDKAPPSNTLIRELAHHFLEPVSGEADILATMPLDVDRDRVAYLKKAVRTYHLNPIAWSDLSLCYATLGHVNKAKRAMLAALSLGNHNRFVLRSAARCFVHLDEPDRAVAILYDSGLCSVDPWIASAEIAISEGSELRSKCLSKGRDMVANENFTSYSRSELASALGTLEMNNGKEGRAKRLLHQSLNDPTENALAQAHWMAKQLGRDTSDMVKLEHKVPSSYEMQARHLFYNKEFSEGLRACNKWSRFEPVSSRAAILSSYIASLCLNDDVEALRVIDCSAPATRKHPIMINNRIFSLARSGNLVEAQKELRKVSARVLEKERYTFYATEGFICFRLGNIEHGRKLYSAAINGFSVNNDPRTRTIAQYFWALEEQRIGSPHAAKLIATVKKNVQRLKIFELEDSISRL